MNTAEYHVHVDEYLDLQKYWLVMKRRWLPATATLVSILGLSVAYALSLEPIYEANAKLLIKSDRSTNLTGIENDTGEIEVISQNSDPLATEAEIIEARPLIETLIQELNLRNDTGKLLSYKSVAGNLKVKTIRGTDVLEISYEDSDPELAASIVNKVIQIYKEQDTRSNRSEASAARNFITEQLPQVEANVKQAEAQLREFKNKYRIANLEQETSITLSNLNKFENQIDDINAELEDVNARYSRLASELGISWQESIAIAALNQSVAIREIIGRLQEVRLDLVQKSNELSKSHPEIVTLEAELSELQQLLEREIKQTLDSQQQALVQNIDISVLMGLDQNNIAELTSLGLQREGLLNKLTALNTMYSSNEQRVDILPQLQEQQNELERRVEAAQSTYETLLTQLQKTRIAEEQNIGKVRVLSEALVPNKSIGPSKKKYVAVGGVLGTLLGIAMAFLLDIRDNRIKNTQEVEEMLAYPLQGVIPDFKSLGMDQQIWSNTALVRDEMCTLALREAYQNIQVNIRYCLDEVAESIRTIAVTSAVVGEGKTTVSANYAAALSQLGKKVLLVDGDLRHPSQHQNWRINNQVGLSNVLSEGLSWQHAIKKVMPNLDVLTAGTIPDVPISLLDSVSMGVLVMNVLEHYDHVIFDTPPLLGLADAKIIAKVCDGLLFVVRPGVATYASVMAAKKILEARYLNLLGVVTNGVNLAQEPLNYEYYSVNKKYWSTATYEKTFWDD